MWKAVLEWEWIDRPPVDISNLPKNVHMELKEAFNGGHPVMSVGQLRIRDEVGKKVAENLSQWEGNHRRWYFSKMKGNMHASSKYTD